MSAATARFVIVGALVFRASLAFAQDAPSSAAAPSPAPAAPASTAGVAPAPASPASDALPPPIAGTAADVEPANLTGTPNPSALAAAAGDDFRFSTHGYFRAPLRVGVGQRPACGSMQTAGTAINGVPCAGPGQSTTNLHSPFLPDDQYLDWRYTRQWEQDWTEVFLNYGNSHVVGTVG
ncbi:MAG TPA: hypothetical protein VH309_15340, partial [Elusimicrobiota bacterium]|nr:hypothetical protein [Elusimicrobiota bacterium]